MVMELLSVFEENRKMAVAYLVGGTTLIILIAILLAFVSQRRRRLNWYEQNVLDITRSPPHYVRCKAFNRLDTEDGKDAPSTSTGVEPRKQSRIIRADYSTEPKAAPSQAVGVGVPRGDLSDIFMVPRASRSNSSMFTDLHQSQIDRGLYHMSVPDSESSYDDESIGCSGSIKLGLSVDTNLGLLTVSLKQAIDLNPKRQDGFPNPYFIVMLDVPESREPKAQQQTRIARNTSSPIINEEFYFQVPSANLVQCRLEIVVYDFDQFSVDECIGYCWLTLGRVNVSTDKENPTVFWAEVLPLDDDTGNGFGEVLMSLTYLSKAQRLTVNVFKARNLRTEAVDNLSSTAIRVTLMNNGEKRLKRKKTSAKKNTKNPQFNESLSFSVAKNPLCDIILEIEAIHEYGTFGMGVKVLARMELPLHKCKDLWRAMIHEEKSQARWYTLEEP